MFYVAMSKTRPGCGGASCIADINDASDAEVIAEFLRDYKGREIRKVDHKEMARLMTIEPSDLQKTDSR